MRLRNRPFRPDLGDIRLRKEKIFKMQLKLAENVSSPPWKIEDIEKALKCLKTTSAETKMGISMKFSNRGLLDQISRILC